MEKHWYWLVGLVLLLALLLRLPLLSGSFWLDEAAQALESARPLSQQLNIRDDFQPPLLHLIVHFAQYGSRAEWWQRLFGAVLPGIFSILGTMLIARKILSKNFSSNGSLLVGILLATNSFHIFFSQELRPYALPMLFAVWSWWVLLQAKHSPKYIISWAILSLLGLYGSYLYPFLLLSQCIYLGGRFWKTKLIQMWLAGLLAIILGFIPWLPSFVGQLQAGQLLRLQLPQWETAVSTSQLKVLPLVLGKFIYGVLDISFNQYFLGSSALIFLSFSIIAIGLLKQQLSKELSSKDKKALILLLIWLLVPLLSAWLVSFFVPVIQPKRVIFLLPAFYLLVVWVFATSQSMSFWFRRAGCTLVGILICINLFSVHQYYTDPRLQRENWRDVLATVSRKHPQAFTLSSFPAPFAPIEWYRPAFINSPMAQDLASGTLHIDSQAAANQVIDDITLLKLTNTMIYFEYLTDLTDPNHFLRTAIENSGYRLQDLLDYPGIGFVRIYQYTPSYALRD
jgi:uncharacterized membrane protein